ncbi:MFS transporter [Eubacteriales bacterium OttesenSCG-928-N13]|nr:MFS transporter [Eubacteriales bacterium OttesenSCG-928-N13]
MVTLLLAAIYLAFISMGLPDAMLGNAWPVMRLAFGANSELAGYVSLTISICTVFSSVASGRAIHRWGAGKVTVASVALTVIALFGFSFSQHYALLILLAIPQGLGAGAIDAALSNYVALHFKAKHMNWLHCFWGVGAMTGPLVLSRFLAQDGNWRGGYQAIGGIQTALLFVLILALPLFKAHAKQIREAREEQPQTPISNRAALRIRGVKPAILSMLCYNGMEAATGLWAATYLTTAKGLPDEMAAAFAAAYFLGITLGRIASGFLSEKYAGKTMIRIGAIVCGCGLIVLALPAQNLLPAAGLLLFGIGCAPVYPSIVHDTPSRFGENASQSVVGLELAGAYVGSTLIPLAVGYLAGAFGNAWIPALLAAFLICMAIACERMNRAAPITPKD